MGTLLTSQSLMKPTSGGAWMGDGSVDARPGSQFLVTAEEGTYGGIAFLSPTAPTKLAADFTKGLVEGVDFTSACAPAKGPTDNGHLVVLAKSSLYSNASLTGTACTIDAGTELTSYSVSNFGGPTQVSSPVLQAQCGFNQAFSADLVYANLIAR
jgi:hypothetical protein